jgi:hypothetical protein
MTKRHDPGARRDKQRRLRIQARDRDEMEKLKELKFMAAQGKQQELPPQWQKNWVRLEAKKAAAEEYEKRVSALEAEVLSLKRSKADLTARLLASWAGLTAAATAALVLWGRLHG